MRWHTYNRYVARFENYEAILEDGIPELLAKLLGKRFRFPDVPLLAKQAPVGCGSH
jgi:hypothetical protein